MLKQKQNPDPEEEQQNLWSIWGSSSLTCSWWNKCLHSFMRKFLLIFPGCKTEWGSRLAANCSYAVFTSRSSESGFTVSVWKLLLVPPDRPAEEPKGGVKHKQPEWENSCEQKQWFNQQQILGTFSRCLHHVSGSLTETHTSLYEERFVPAVCRDHLFWFLKLLLISAAA